MTKTMVAAAAAAAMLAGCSGGGDAPDNIGTGNVAAGNEAGVVLRDLPETNLTAAAREDYTLQGTLVATPSDPKDKFFLLRERRTLTGTIIAILRQERGNRIVYARAEVDCAKRLFHVLGVGPSRAAAELHQTYDGPLRPIAGLPLRQELATYICERSGTPLSPA